MEFLRKKKNCHFFKEAKRGGGVKCKILMGKGNSVVYEEFINRD